MTARATLLDGRVHHQQAGAGHRTGIEPVLLAAAVAARAGELVLEGGTGSGAALLCLVARCPGVSGVGIEQDADQAALARSNIIGNGMVGLTVLTGDITGSDWLRQFAGASRFDHAMANPPWHHPAGTMSPDGAREGARRAGPGLLATWTKALAATLRHHGSLTLIIPASALADCIGGLPASGCGSATVLPLWPKVGREAKIVLLRAIKGGRGPSRLLPGLVLHEPDGSYTPPTNAILRDGEGLVWAAG